MTVAEHKRTASRRRGPGTVRANRTKRVGKRGPERISVDAVRDVCRSYKSARQIAAELGTSPRTIQRRLVEIEAAGYTLAVRSSWDGEYATHAPHYKISGKAKR
jgi:IS30 family transposase